MIDTFYELAMESAMEYNDIVRLMPKWLLLTYIGITAISVIYAAVGTRTVNRLFWITISLVFPFVALPIEIIADIVAVQYRKKHPSQSESRKKNCRIPFRLRFIGVPAIGAVVGLFAGSIIISFSSGLLNDMQIPYTLTGALLALLILFLTEYIRSRRNILYFKIAKKGKGINYEVPPCDIFGHSVYTGGEVSSDAAERIIEHFSSNSQKLANKEIKEIPVDNTVYVVTFLDKNEFRNIRDVESVTFKGIYKGCVYDVITCVEWNHGNDRRLTELFSGTRIQLWRAAPLNIPLIFEALTPAMTIFFALTPAGLIFHSSILRLVAGWFNV